MINLRNLYKKFKIRLDYFLQNANITGIRFLSKEYPLFGRLFWLIVICISFWSMLNILFLTSERFDSNTISIGIDTSFLHWNSTFPAISLCLAKGTASRHILNFIRERNISYPTTETSYLRNIHSYIFTNPNHISISQTQCDGLNSTCGIDIEQLRDEILPHICRDVISEVQYNKKTYKNCEDIFKFHETEMGFCFIANSLIDYNYSFDNLPLKFNRETKDRSLQLYFKKTTFWSYAFYVHSPEDLPTFNLESLPLSSDSVHLYYSIEEIINEEDVEREDIDKRGCRFPYEKLEGSTFHYSFSTCMSDLRISVELEYCNCTLNTGPKIYKNVYCTIPGLYCLENVGVSSIVKNLHYDSEKTSCLPSCLEQTLNKVGEIEIEDEDFPSNVGKILVEIIDLPKLRYIRSVSLTRLDLVVTIGGVVGLYFGASIINIVEFIYIWLIRKF